MIRVSAVGLVLLLLGCGRDAAAPSIANAAPTPTAPALVAGELRLEGQVIDDNGVPLAGVEIALETEPRLVTTSEADGYYAFDGLAAGDYAIVARTGDGRVDRASVALSPTSEPVILRLR